jgi:hypothetical protein
MSGLAFPAVRDLLKTFADLAGAVITMDARAGGM